MRHTLVAHQPPRHRYRGGAALAALLVAVTGCSAPVAPLEVGMNTRSVDLLLGERIRVVSTAPPTSVPVEVLVPQPVGPPSPPSALPPSPPPEIVPDEPPPPIVACPAAPPDASLLNQVVHTATLPPAPAAYQFRTKGQMTVGDQVTRLPDTITREITNVEEEEPAGSFLFDVITTVGEDTTTATFRIVPAWYPEKPPDTALAESLAEGLTGTDVPDEDKAGARVKPGLYLVQVDSAFGSARLPDPGIKLVDFPIEIGATFQAVGTDGVTTMDYTSTVSADRPRVDACGTLIDTYQIDLEGTVTQVTEQGTVTAEFTSSYAIATQFGGLIVYEKTEVTSEDPTADVSRTVEATINSVPAEPAEPGDGQ